MMGTFQMGDLENLREFFPMETNGEPNWAIACGVAVALLLEADRVEGREYRARISEDERVHKDLDVFVFHPERAKIALNHPHEVYRAEFFQKPQRCIYRNHDVDQTGFFFEFMHGYHFGFPPPQQDDAVKVIKDDQTLWTLSPEYIIASRCFSIARIREHVDDVDVVRLARRFSIDMDRLDAIVGRSAFRFLPRDLRVYPANEGPMEQSVLIMMRPELERRFQSLLNLVSPVQWRGLLLFEQEELPRSLFARAANAAKDWFGCPDISPVGATMFALASLPPDRWERVREETVKRLPQERTWHLTPYLHRLILDLRKETRRLGWTLAGLEEVCVHAFLTTGYVHVILAKMAEAGSRLRNIPTGDGDRADIVYDDLFRLLGKPTWRRMEQS